MDGLFGGNIHIQICAAILVVAGFVEMVIGSMIRDIVKSRGFGAWWAGAFCVITGVIGIFNGNLGMRALGYTMGVFAAIISVAGLIVDGIGYGVVHVLDTCESNTGIYGEFSPQALLDVTQCYAEHSSWDCTCINIYQEGFCISFNLVSDTGNCEQILGSYTELLLKSTKCLDFLVAFTIFYCIFFCIFQFCPSACSCFPTHKKEPLANQQYPTGQAAAPPLVYFVQAQDQYPPQQQGQPTYNQHVQDAAYIQQPGQQFGHGNPPPQVFGKPNTSYAPQAVPTAEPQPEK